MSNTPETLADEFVRLVREYREDPDSPTGAEAWNLIADFAVANATPISAALQSVADTPSAPYAQLQVTNPSTIAQFVGALADHGVKLPLLPTEDDIGTLVDADGKPVLVVDVDRQRSDEDVAWIVGMIQVAVNTCGGFIAVRAFPLPR